MRESTKRLFVSLELPAQIRVEVERLSDRLRSHLHSGARLVPKHQLHCTLVFLGSVPESRITTIVERLQSIAFDPITMKLGTIEFFERGFSLIVYVQVLSPTIAIFAEEVSCALTDLCPQESRKYTGHITLARIKEVENVTHLRSTLAQISVKPVRSVSDTIYLNESMPTPQGHVHKKLATVVHTTR